LYQCSGSLSFHAFSIVFVPSVSGFGTYLYGSESGSFHQQEKVFKSKNTDQEHCHVLSLCLGGCLYGLSLCLFGYLYYPFVYVDSFTTVSLCPDGCLYLCLWWLPILTLCLGGCLYYHCAWLVVCTIPVLSSMCPGGCLYYHCAWLVVCTIPVLSSMCPGGCLYYHCAYW
jgi:hypothetical protein